MRRERAIKKMGRSRKLRLIEEASGLRKPEGGKERKARRSRARTGRGPHSVKSGK